MLSLMLIQNQWYQDGQECKWIAATPLGTDARLMTTDDDFDHLDPDFIPVDKISTLDNALLKPDLLSS